jgi:signal transduction histidine kinase
VGDEVVYPSFSFRLGGHTQSSRAVSEHQFVGVCADADAPRRDESLRPHSARGRLHTFSSAIATASTTPVARYAAALVVTALGVIARRLLLPVLGDHVPFALVYGAVVISAVCLGLGPSIAAAVAGIVAVRIIFVTHGFFTITSVPELSETLTYIGGCSLIISAAEATRRSRDELKAANRELALRAERLANFNEKLERRVEERTADLQHAEEAARRLGAQVLRLQDEERRRIARDLHESVGQEVAVLNMSFGRLSRSEGLTEEELAIVADGRSIAKDLADEVRTISYLLHPPMLDDLGLPAALKWYVAGFSKRSEIETTLQLSDDFGRLAPDCEIAIFRVVQEALTNIHRHSGSARAAVRVMKVDAGVTLEIADEGKGIAGGGDANLAAGGLMGVGLRGMRERITQLGGQLSLQSNQKGTTVRATFPGSEIRQKKTA